MCRHWGRGAEPAPGLGLSHKHGWEAFAGAECSSQAGSKGKRLYFPHLKKFLLVLDLHWAVLSFATHTRCQSEGEGRRQPDIRIPNPLGILNFAFRENPCHLRTGLVLLQEQDDETVVELPGWSCPTQNQILGWRGPDRSPVTELTWLLLQDWQQGLPGMQMFLQEWVFHSWF